MNTTPSIIVLERKHLIGMSMPMSFAQHDPSLLWKVFQPRKKEIQNRIGENLYSLEVYPIDFFREFDMQRIFQKWAAIETSDTSLIPNGMQCIDIFGMYAVFNYQGTHADAKKFYSFIFQEWLPSSSYILDERPHFACMDENYIPNDPYSQETIWIPIQNKR